MKLRYLGTAAAEGVPALFCECENCKRSRAAGGRAIRTRSQALVDNQLLIDFPADTYKHILDNNIDLCKISHCLITHTHSDHLYPTDFAMLEPGYSHVPDGYKLHIYGSDAVSAKLGAIAERLAKHGICELHEVKPFETFMAGEFEVTALPAIHDKNAGPLFYIIRHGGKTLLWAHDTNYFSDEVWDYLASAKPRFDLVSLDCTNSCLPLTYVGHMGLAENIKAKERLISLGCADANTVFVSNHFSHNGINAVYDDFVPIAARAGFKVSFDGGEFEF